MRPQAIITFERLYLAGVVISVLNFALTFNAMSQATVAGQSVSLVPLIAGFCIGIAIYLLLWFLIARKASNVARWALVVVFILGLIGVPGMISPPMALAKVLGLVGIGLHLAAIIFLFQKDTAAWFAGEERAGPL